MNHHTRKWTLWMLFLTISVVFIVERGDKYTKAYAESDREETFEELARDSQIESWNNDGNKI